MDKSDEIMASAVSTLDQVTVTAESGAKAIEDSGNVLADTRTAVGQFSTEFSNGLSNGETLLNIFTENRESRDSKRSDNSKEYTYFTGKTCERK